VTIVTIALVAAMFLLAAWLMWNAILTHRARRRADHAIARLHKAHAEAQALMRDQARRDPTYRVLCENLPWWIDVDAVARDPQEDYPPPLRKPTGDRSCPPVSDPDSSQVSDAPSSTQEAE